MTVAERRSYFKLTIDLTGELLGSYCEDIDESWPQHLSIYWSDIQLIEAEWRIYASVN